MDELTEHARRNRAEWDRMAADYYEPGRRAWAREGPDWGVWSIPEAQLRVLDEVAGKDVLEAGCGTAYFSSWLARRGARVVGLDNSPKQLEHAREFQREFRLEFPLVLGSAEAMPFPDESFDIVFSEYGASIWADPYLWIPEAARVLRPGGQLAFLVNGTPMMLCADEMGNVGTELRRDYFGMHRFEWPDTDEIEFHLGYGDWIRVLRANGLEIEDLIEVQAPQDAKPHRFPYLPGPEWARRWPSEDIWKARKTA